MIKAGRGIGPACSDRARAAHSRTAGRRVDAAQPVVRSRQLLFRGAARRRGRGGAFRHPARHNARYQPAATAHKACYQSARTAVSVFLQCTK